MHSHPAPPHPAIADLPAATPDAPGTGALPLQIARLRARQMQQTLRADRQHSQIAALATQLRQADARFVALSVGAAALAAEVAALRGSTSWRITAPLRALRRGWWALRGPREQTSQDEIRG